jgi:hypothetical protein
VGRPRHALLDPCAHLVADVHTERFDHLDPLIQQDSCMTGV